MYSYNATRTMEGQPAPVLFIYYLKGDTQDCGGIGNLANGTGTTLTKATVNYSGSSGGATICSISVPGPAS